MDLLFLHALLKQEEEHMSCCGQKRQALSASNSTWQPTPAVPDPVASYQSPTQSLVAVDSTGPTVTLLSRHGVTSLTGVVTGKHYHFQGRGAMQTVDQQDADAMITSGAFEQV